MAELDAKQKLLIEYLISDKESFVKCYGILKPEYFESPMDRVVQMILTHFQNHSGIPNTKIIKAETGIKLDVHELDNSDRSFLIDEIEDHCKNAAMENAVLASADLISEGNREGVYELIRSALTVKIDKSIGIELMSGARERLELENENNVSYSCGISEIDEMIGYFRREEMFLAYAVTGGGKSIYLGNATRSFAHQGLDVAIVTLELKEELYSKRMDALFTGYELSDIKSFAFDVDAYYENLKDTGNVTIKKMLAGSTVNDIEAYLLEYHLHYDKYPDVLIVDYIGLMGVPDGQKFFNKFDLDHEKAKGLIRLAGQYGMIVHSAGQINRDGYDVAKVNPSHCAGGMSLINDSDGAFALVATEEDLDNNQVQAVPLKIRHAPKHGGNITLYRDAKNLRITGKPTNVESPRVSSPLGKKKQEVKESKSEAKSKLAKALGK